VDQTAIRTLAALGARRGVHSRAGADVVGVASSQRPCRASATVVSPMFTDRRGDVGSGWPRDSRQGRADSRSSDPSPCFRRFAGRRLRDRSRVRTRQQRGARRLSSCTGCGRWHQEVAEVAAMMAVPRGRGSLPLSEKTIRRALGELLPSVPHVRSDPSGRRVAVPIGRACEPVLGVAGYSRSVGEARRDDVRFAAECFRSRQSPERPGVEAMAGGVDALVTPLLAGGRASRRRPLPGQPSRCRQPPPHAGASYSGETSG
jgi:hypothetical protein